MSEIYNTLNVEIPVGYFFNNPTVSKLSKYIDKINIKEGYKIMRMEKKEYYQCSSVQKRLFFYDSYRGEQLEHNLLSVYF